MIIKDYFADGLLQIAIVLSLLRSDLFFGSSVAPLQVHDRFLEINVGPLSGITRTDFRIRSRELVRDYPKTIDDDYNYRFSSVLRELHSLSDFRRFDGISTSFHTWLVNEGGPSLTSSVENQPSTADSVPEASGGTGSISASPDFPESPVIASELSSLDLFVGDELLKEDMELINILYLQDIDLGIERDTFDAVLANDAQLNGTKSPETSDNQTVLLEASQHDANELPVGDSFPPLHLSGQYVIDTETGELVLASTSPVTDPLNVNLSQPQAAAAAAAAVSYQTITQERPVSDGDTLSSGVAGLQLADGRMFQHGHSQSAEASAAVGYERQLSYEQHWEDMLSLLDIQSVLGGNTTLSDGDWQFLNETDFESQYDTAQSGLMQNVSMAASVIPSETSITASDFGMLSSVVPYEPAAVANDSMSFFPTTNFSAAATDLSFNSSSNMDMSEAADLDSTFGLNENYSFVYDLLRESASSQYAEQGMYGFVTGAASVPQLQPLPSPPAVFAELSQQQMVPGLSPTQSGVTLTSPTNATMADTNALFQQLLRGDVLAEPLDIDDDELVMDSDMGAHGVENHWSTDSAVSSMDSPLYESTVDMPLPDGASGGFEYDAASKYPPFQPKTNPAELNYYQSFTRYENTMEQNSSTTNSSYYYHDDGAATDLKHIRHNHTYPLGEGQRSRSEIEEEARREKEQRAMRSRDEKKAKAMQIPLTMDEMIDTSVEHFNELLSRHKLTDAQNQLIRDIRRRGKNKVAAQNCRKRKLEVIQTVEEELAVLRRQRDSLRRERSNLDRSATSLKEKFGRLEAELFRRLHTETGQEYDPRMYSVLQTDDGRVFIVPRENVTAEQAHDEKSARKRKPKKKD